MADIQTVRERQRALRVPEEFEWVDDVTPGLALTAESAGLAVDRVPLLVRDPAAPIDTSLPGGHTARFLDPRSPDLGRDLALAHAVATTGFAASGTAVGPAGAAERDAALRAVSATDVEHSKAGFDDGAIARVLVETDEGAVCVGSYQRAGDVAEIVGVATLPSARRRGLGRTVTALLSRHAQDAGVAITFLSAADVTVARIYERVGFHRVGTACLAGPA